jgi:hypothetical protein
MLASHRLRGLSSAGALVGQFTTNQLAAADPQPTVERPARVLDGAEPRAGEGYGPIRLFTCRSCRPGRCARGRPGTSIAKP